MLPVTLALSLAAAPVVIRVDLQDALRLPSGVETPPARPIVVWLRAPASWAVKGALTEAGKAALLARLYGSTEWMKGNADGSTYVVKTFTSRVLGAGERPTSGPQTWWYEVGRDGALEKRGLDFSAPLEPKQPTTLMDHAVPGSAFRQGASLADRQAALEWLARQQGPVRVAVTLARGPMGFSGRGAKAGALELACDDSRLGVSLADRARQACGDAPTCELWLIGTWRAADGVLEVTKVDGAVSPHERALEGFADHVWYQVK